MLLKTKIIMILYPNAKINIGLNVLNQRSDGYHNISSVFYPVMNLYDILEVIPSHSFSFSCSGIPISDKNNICIKAFELLRNDFDFSNVSIHLDKRIPIGAGLGGGSSDASFMLKALNNLFNLRISNRQLEIYALKLGADCPFFIDNTPKYVTGVGDIMTPVSLDFSRYDIQFIFSDIHVSTVQAYSDIRLNNIDSNLLDLIHRPLKSWKGNIFNDFEDSVFLKYPVLEENKKKLYSNGAIYASMTGSGSVLYGFFNRNLSVHSH